MVFAIIEQPCCVHLVNKDYFIKFLYLPMSLYHDFIPCFAFHKVQNDIFIF